MSRPILVLGAGPAGLAAAASLLRRGREVVVLESASRAGGMLRSVRRDGFLAEEGPHSMRLAANGPVRAFLRDTGAIASLVEADPAAAKKFVTHAGRPVAAPAGPLGALASPLLTWSEKLRFACEPFIPRRRAETEETVKAFVSRRLGPGAYAALVDAVVGGVYAGDGDTLAVRHAFPTLWNFEHAHGSLVRGALATGKDRRARGALTVASFAGGMADLPAALATPLGHRLHTGAITTRIARTDTGWAVEWRDQTGATHAGDFEKVVVATPAHAWGDLGLPDTCAPLVAAGAAIPHPWVGVVTLGYARERVAHPLDGFGVLSPGREHRAALGVLFSSSVFPRRAPDGAVTLSLFLGGARQPELATRSRDELLALARAECEQLLGAHGAPDFAHVASRSRAIPQYTPGHGERIAVVEATERAHPGLVFIGNHRGGPALPAAIENALATADRLVAEA